MSGAPSEGRRHPHPQRRRSGGLPAHDHLEVRIHGPGGQRRGIRRTKGADPSRIAAQIVSGVSFLGVGIIYRDVRYATKGLTTAAGIWAVSAIGMAIGCGMYVAGIFTTAFILGLQIFMHKHMVGADLYNDMKIEITMKDSPELREEINRQLTLWDPVIVEEAISRTGAGLIKYSFTLKSRGKLTYKDVHEYMSKHPDIQDFKIYGEF